MTRRELGDLKTTMNVALLVALSGMVFVYPFATHFRLTLGVVVLGVLLLYFHELPPLLTAALSGAMIFLTRSTVNFVAGDESYWSVAIQNLPSLFYYVSFGLLFQLLRVRSYVKNASVMILLLSMTDVLSNCVELAFRGEWSVRNLEVVIVSIITVGIIRAALAAYGYFLLKHYRSFVLAEEQVARYAELTMMIAQLKSELFYLRKSSQDIEEVMEESYALYKHLHGTDQPELGEAGYSQKALSIARKIHEVKKDYYRVASGIENILKPSTIERGMPLSEIFLIIEQNTKRNLQATGKQIDVAFHYQDDWVTNKHYTIVSILNNLVTNSIEACGDRGNIKVTQIVDDDFVVFSVEDDGEGVKARDYGIIFQVGYSTKFCPYTGKMSTGLGLSHVRDLTEMLGGTIGVVSEQGLMTRFTVRLPIDQLI